jgi:peptidoglycan L-alanyl-D-glutamate endopeptidase CwlK
LHLAFGLILTYKKGKKMFEFGTASLEALAPVHKDLQKVAHRALALSTVDFRVVEGMRTLARQKQLVAQGKSKTMNSRHLTGHAIDFCPVVNGQLDWNNEKNFTEVAEAFRKAAVELDVEILWGRAWHLALNYHPSAQAALDSYVADSKKKGKRPFLDGPHVQLTTRSYP